MPRSIYSRKPKTEASTTPHDPGSEPLYMEIVVPSAGLVLKMLDNPQHVACTVRLTRDGVSHVPNNGKKPSRALSWKTIRQIAAMGFAVCEGTGK